MAKIISMNDYKRKHGIALPRSPYYTLDASDEELQAAVERAKPFLESPHDYRGLPPYAVVIGYENLKTGKIKLLKELHIFPSKHALEHMEGIRGYNTLYLKRTAES